MAYQSEIEKLEQRYQENPKQWFAALADAYRKNGDLDLALEYVKGGLEMRPDYASGHIVLGRCLLDKNEDDAAGQAFEHVLQLDAENIIALKSLSDIAHRRGDNFSARRWLTRLLEVDPMNDEARETLDGLGGPIAASAAEPEPGAAAGTDAVETPPEPEMRPAAATEPGAAWAAEALAEAHRKEQEEAKSSEPEPLGSPASELPAAEPDGPAGSPIGELPDEFVVERASGGHVAQVADSDAPGAEPEAPEGAEEPGPVDAELEREPTIGELESQIGDQPSVSEEMEVVSFADPGAWVEQPAASSESVGIDPEDLAPAIDFLGDPSGVAARESQADNPHTPVESGPAVDPDESEGGLPLVSPRDSEEPVASDEAGEPVEPEPMVTETMAEVYARQGLFDQAREIYQKLLARHPGVTAFEQRLRELTDQASAVTEASDTSQSRYAASLTGGESTVKYLRRIFSGEPEVEPETSTRPDATEPPSADSALASAFGDAVDALGSPTMPAADDVSLASVFGGDRHAPPGSRSGSEPPPPQDNAVSFDEFYGSTKKERRPEETPSQRDDDDDESPDDDFKHWLEGLKT